MKTLHTLILLLHKLCNQRNVFDYMMHKRQVYLKLLLLLLIFYFPNLSKANTIFNAADRNHFNFTLSAGNDALNSGNFRLLILDANGINDVMKSADLYFYEDDGITLTKIASFSCASSLSDAKCTPVTSTDAGYYKDWGTTTSGGYYYFTGTWVYPQRLSGKNLKFCLKYKWDRDHNGINAGTTNTPTNTTDAWGDQVGSYDMNFQLPKYKVITTSLDFEPLTNNLVHVIYNINNSSSMVNGISFLDDNNTILKSYGSPVIIGSPKDTTFTWLTTDYNAPKKLTVRYQYTIINSTNSATPGCADKTYTYDSIVTFPGFKYPTNIIGTYSPSRQNINISWTAGNASAGSEVKYYVKRGNTLLTPTPISSLNYTDPAFGSASTWNWSNYTYTVYAVSAKTGSRMGSQDSIQSLKSKISVSTSPKIPDFKDFVLIAHPTNGTIQPYMEVKWDSTQWSPQNNISNSTLKLWHRPSTSNTFTQYTLSTNTQSYNDNNVTDNSKHFYKLEVNVFGRTFSQIDSETVVKKVAFKSIKATKNTIGDRIQLTWEIDRLDLCDRFEIYRSYSKDSSGVDVNTTAQLVQQLSAQTLYSSWDDMTAAPGVVYQYYIKAYKTGTDGTTRLTVSSTDIGFRMPVGTVTGRITYGGGTAVAGVSVYLNGSGLDNNLLYKSMQFGGNSTQKGDVALTKAQHGCITNGFTFQTWLTSSRPTTYSPVFEVNNEYSIGLKNDSVFTYIGAFNINNPTLKCKLPSSISQNSYFNLSVSLGKNDSLKIFINGKLAKSILTSHISNCSFVDEVVDATTGNITTPRTKSYIAKTTDDNSNSGDYSGFIDDVRLWSSAIADTVISENYNHYLGGNETNLIGYWPLDEGINSRAFDCSKTDQRFNEHHIIFKNANTSNNVPSSDQLSIKGLTDKDGSYIIRGIPFTGTGSTYNIRPVLGIHKFEPTQLVRYISPSSLVHNSSDFTDKSSFPVKVRVKYSNTGYPVPGVMFYVDENSCSKENKLITTASQLTYDNTRTGDFKTINVGECVIDVPIGEHYIRAELSGHDFENNGRWPAIGKQVFDENSVTNIDFADTTLITVVGRVVGGAIENSYPIGFKNSDNQRNHSSHANIGKAKIVMEPSILKNYFINTASVDSTMSMSGTEAAKFGSVVKFPKTSSKVEITTDAQTGEYMVKLPPIKWDIVSVQTSTTKDYTYDLNLISSIQSFTTSKFITATDTIKNIETNKVDSFTYNVKKSFVYTAPTAIEVINSRTGGVAFGESEWIVKSLGEPDEIRPLYQINGSTPKSVQYRYGVTTDYPNGKPIFCQGREYDFNIYAYESYKHPEGLDTTTMKQYAKVPLKGAVVTVKNEIGVLSKKVVPDPSDTIENHVMKLDSNGKVNYGFKAGFPNLTDIDSGLGLTITVKNGNSAPVIWDELNDFRGIVTGQEPIAGTNFVTNGPDKALVVLRDPPGSNSYAYMQTGTTLSYSFTNKSVFNANNAESATVRIGPKITTGGGFGLMVLGENEIKDDVKIGVEGEYSSFTGSTGTKTITTTEKIQTSASPDFVGSNADVYIGVSTNLYLCQSRDLEITKNGLTVSTVNTADLSGGTDFRFTQNEILTAQIPKWTQILNQQLVNPTKFTNYASAKAELQVQADADNKNRYITSLYPTDSQFGTTGTYEIIKPQGQNLVLPDDIETAVNSINNWQNMIKANEEKKRNASKDENLIKDNISFDAGTSIERSYTYTDNKGSTSGGSDKTQAVIGGTTGFVAWGIGVQLDAEVKLGGGSESENNSSTEKTTTFGYVLSDPDADNRFAINVYKNKLLSTTEKDLPNLKDSYVDSSLGSYIFELAGGQSSCPYEAADSSLFYKENNMPVKLANGTMPLDAPYISIKNFTKTDIPNGKDATFTLELGNNSIVQSPRGYMLTVDDTTNPNGAIISVDGTPLNGGRIFYVTPGQILNKTLTLHQSKLDVLDYKDIKLNFSSICDGAISVAQNINVSYVPSCSDLDIALDRQIINADNAAPLTVSLKNFNQEYKNFLGIQLEYKMEGDTRWSSKVFAKDQDAKTALTSMNINTDMLIPNTGNGLISSFDYPLSFDGLNDGNYTVRAKTLCSNGTQTPINNMTTELSVIKDLVRPMAMGIPSPANGILTPETELSVTFNENIQTSKLIPENFEVKGVLNGATLQHAEGLALDGTLKSQAFTESSLSMQNGSFSIEGWVRTSTDCQNYGNLFTIGTGADKVALNMKKDGMQLAVNDIVISSKTIPVKTDWQYVSLSYNSNTQTICVNLMQSDASLALISQKLTNPVNPVGRLLVGAGYKGNIHQVSVWSETRSISDLADMNTSKIGNENNLIGYWPMDEATGTIAIDKARSRNMTVNSSWFIEPNGKASSYNGINQSTLFKTSEIGITKNDNFSIEFWFKGKSQTNATLFSCGKGDIDGKPTEKLSVGFNSGSEFCLNTNGNSYIIPSVSVLDTIWHHFALSVTRNGNSNVYVDGQQKLQLPSAKVGGLSTDTMSLGSRYFTDSVLVNGKFTSKKVQDCYFNGSMDEVRIWKSALSAENIRLDMHSRLTGTEVGLIAYYPFEETAVGNVVNYSLKDFSSTNVGSAKSTAESTSNTAGIKIPRAKEDVSFSFTASDNKIILLIDAPLAKIEKSTLEFAVKNVYDLNGNMLQCPIKWTAYVNNNQLNWETETVNITKQVLDAATFKATIVNNSGKYENYVIDGLPGWLSVDKSSGRLNPLQKTELNFTIDNSTNVGSYESRISLTGNNGIQELLPVSLKVTGPRPDWSVNPYDYESSMNITGQVQLEGVYQEDTEDILAAFIGTRCIGIASPQFNKTLNSYMIYMDLYGNSDVDTGLPVSFSLWDASTGRIYPGVDVIGGSIQFVSGAMVGSLTSPKTFNATDKVEQQLSIKKGWNWISTNVVSSTPSLLDQVKTGMETDGLMIKSKSNGYIEYAGAWDGNLTTLYQKSMYLLKSGQTKTIKVVGATAKSVDYPITIGPNWNWIGYIPQFVAPVQVALSGLTANEGDQIKGQIGFATYSGGTWTGSLQYLVPGIGYMYYSNNTEMKTFVYPSQYLSTSRVKRYAPTLENAYWTFAENNYQSSMTVTGIAKIDNIEVANTNLQIGVFIDDVCRGAIELLYSSSKDRYFAYISVWGNASDLNKKITFKCYDPTSGKEIIAADKTLGFIPDNIVGSSANPFVINFSTTVTGEQKNDLNQHNIYPNPVVNTLYFNYDPKEIELFEIVDCIGRTQVYSKAMNKNSVDVGSLVPGIYTLRVTCNGINNVHMFIKK